MIGAAILVITACVLAVIISMTLTCPRTTGIARTTSKRRTTSADYLIAQIDERQRLRAVAERLGGSLVRAMQHATAQATHYYFPPREMLMILTPRDYARYLYYLAYNRGMPVTEYITWHRPLTFEGIDVIEREQDHSQLQVRPGLFWRINENR